MVGANKSLNTRRMAALARRTSALYPLRNLALTFAGAAHPYTVALPADPDSPLDRFATILNTQSEKNTELHEDQWSATEAVDASPGNSVKLPSTPRNAASTSPFLSAPKQAADQARRAVATGTHMPYWGLLWPSGLALAEALLTKGPSFGSARAVELGCGLGVTATAALDCGISLTAMDCFSEALLFTRYNARRATGREPRTLLADWRSPEGRAACLTTSPLDILLAADILYEEEDIAPLLDLAPTVLAPGGTFWLAEPGRRVSRIFVEAAHGRGWHSEEHVYERAWPPDGDVVRVSVHRFERLC